MTGKSKTPRNLLLLAALVSLGAAAWYGAGRMGWLGENDAQTVQGTAVRRGPLRISVLQRGNLSARNSVQLLNELEGRAVILYLIPEGTMVEKGDLVAELDASQYEDQRVSQEISLENAKSTLIKAQQNLEIQKSQNASDVARAEQVLTFAEADLRKYLEGDWPQQRQQAEEDIILAREELAQAQDQLDWSTKLEADGFLTRTRLEEDQLAYESSKIRLERSERAKKLLIEYDHPKEKAQLDAAVEEARRELERVNLQAQARLVDFETELRTAQSKLILEQEKQNKLLRQIAAAKIYAPTDGMLVYGRTEGQGRYSNEEPIKEGTEVRERQEIATIPKPGGMIVEASLHESVLKKVREGQPCVIRVEALPGHEFQGRVLSVAHLADKGSFWVNPDQRLYRTEISIASSSADMRPGMSCSVEIIVEEILDTLFMPVQSVVYHGGRTVCFVDQGGKPQEREISVGQSNDKWVQALSGVAEGEVVLLNPPPGFVPSGVGSGERPESLEEGSGPPPQEGGERPRDGEGDGDGEAAQPGGGAARPLGGREGRRRPEGFRPPAAAAEQGPAPGNQ